MLYLFNETICKTLNIIWQHGKINIHNAYAVLYEYVVKAILVLLKCA